MSSQPKLLLCGWDSADWRTINEILDAGEMPNLAGLVRRGSMGTLLARPPFLDPPLWTTLATGLTPDQHGILTSVERDALTGDLRPPSRTSRRAPAVWDLLSRAGFVSHVVGWPVTHPAGPLSGVVLSDLFARPAGGPDAPWPVLPGFVWPAEAERQFLDFRMNPAELTGDDLLPFVPDLAEIDQRQDARLLPLAFGLAETVTLHAAATALLERHPWQFLAVCYPLLGRIARHYMRYAPPRMENVSERDAHIFGGVVRAAYRFLDMMLGRLLELAGESAHVLLVSQRGFLHGSLRPEGQPVHPAGDGWPRDRGIVCLAGPGVRPDELVFGARAVDIAPTVLASFGIAAPPAMGGRILTEAFSRPLVVAPAAAVPDPEPVVSLPDQASEALLALSAAGMTDPLSGIVREDDLGRAWSLGCVYLVGGHPETAIPEFEAALRANPGRAVIRLHLAYAYLLAGRLDECAATVAGIEPAAPEAPFATLVRARLLLVQSRTAEALELLAATEADQSAPLVQTLLGDVHRSAGAFAAAERCYRNAIERDPDLVASHVGLAAALLGQGRNEEAAAPALDAIGRDYALAAAHYLLGIALVRTRRFAGAVHALRTCLCLAPEHKGAAELLALLGQRVRFVCPPC